MTVIYVDTNGDGLYEPVSSVKLTPAYNITEMNNTPSSTYTFAGAASGVVTTTVVGTANQVIANTVGSTTTLSTPQSTATTSDLVFNTVSATHLIPANRPVASISATTGLGVGGSITTSPPVGQGYHFSRTLVATSGTPAAGEMFLLTYPTAIPGTSWFGEVTIINTSTGVAVAGTVARTSSTVATVSSLGTALTTGTTYSVIVKIYAY